MRDEMPDDSVKKDDRYLVRIEASMKLDVDLYRGGNATSPRFDNVRDTDLIKIPGRTPEETKVKGMSGGISAFTAPAPKKNEWWIKAGTVVPLKLTVIRGETTKGTNQTHYFIMPAETMLLSEYVKQMQSFTGVEKLSLERAIALSGRWENVKE
jgi:hypothetical protein